MKALVLGVIVIAIAVLGLRGCGCACGGDQSEPRPKAASKDAGPSIVGYWEEIENGKPISIAAYNENGTFRIQATDPRNPARKLRASGDYTLKGGEMIQTYRAFSFLGVNERQRAQMAASMNRRKDLPEKSTVEWVDPKEFRLTEASGRTSVWRKKPGT